MRVDTKTDRDTDQHELTVTHTSVLSIALPIIASNVTTPLIAVTDTAVLGQSGDATLIAAVALGGMIFTTLLWAFGFLRMGTTGITAQAYGAGETGEVFNALLRACVIAMTAGIVIVILQAPIKWAAFELIPATSDAEAAAGRYFDIRVWSSPAALINYALIGWLVGLGRARIAFLLQLLLNGTNIILSVVLVLGLNLGIAGAAWGTVVAEIIAAGVGIFYAWSTRGASINLTHILRPSAMKRMIAVNADIMIRTLCLIFAFSFFTAQSSAGGDVQLAANHILLQFLTVAAYFLDGFAFAAESVVGRSIGARNRNAFVQAARISTLWAFAFACAIGFLTLFAGDLALDAMAKDAEVQKYGRSFLGWAVIAPVLGVACYQLDGIFIGATRTADMRNMMILSTLAYLVAWWALAEPLGNHGLWVALMVFFLARTITLSARLPALMEDAFSPPSAPPQSQPAH